MNPLEYETLVRGERELWWFQGMNQILFRLLDATLAPEAVERALDAGCGTGYTATLLEDRYGWRMFPADRSGVGLSHARRAGMERLAQADIAALPYAAGAFRLALCLDALVHFDRGAEQTALAEFFRVLEPGGTLVVRVAALNILRSRHSEFVDERQRFTRRQLIAAAERAGFRVTRCTYANSLLMPVALARFRVWEPLTRQPLKSATAPIAPWLNRLLRLPLAAEAAWLGAGLNFPLGQSLILTGVKP